jgi:hypothetical protein
MFASAEFADEHAYCSVSLGHQVGTSNAAVPPQRD